MSRYCCSGKSAAVVATWPLSVTAANASGDLSALSNDEELEETTVKVVVRVRPFISREGGAGAAACVDVIDGSSLRVRGDKNVEFTFDSVLGAGATQKDTFTSVAMLVLAKALKGFNGCVFAYGQTGSGKTFAMEGSSATAVDAAASSADYGKGGGGIIPQLAAALFSSVGVNGLVTLTVRVSYVEIYQERLVDLLCGTSSSEDDGGLFLRQTPAGEIFLEGVTMRDIGQLSDLQRVVAEGSLRRSRGETNMNAASSRSHAVLTLFLNTSFADGVERRSKLHLIDLAGSERADATGATGARLREGAQINKSLSALGGVISALTEAGRPHVPYRDSKLTRLLQDSLGGNAVTAMLCCVSPAMENHDETLSSLRFAERAKRVRNRAIMNVDPTAAKLVALERALRAALERGVLLETSLARRLGLVAPLRADDAAGKAALDAEVARTRDELAASNGAALPPLVDAGHPRPTSKCCVM